MSNWMWLQFAPYVKSKSRLFWKSPILSFFPKSGVCCRPFLAGAFFSFFLRHILNKCHIWSKKDMPGPDFLKNDDIWSDSVILDLL